MKDKASFFKDKSPESQARFLKLKKKIRAFHFRGCFPFWKPRIVSYPKDTFLFVLQNQLKERYFWISLEFCDG